MSGTDHKVTRFVVFSTLLLRPSLLGPKLFCGCIVEPFKVLLFASTTRSCVSYDTKLNMVLFLNRITRFFSHKEKELVFCAVGSEISVLFKRILNLRA